jgi:dienelactone hydrolase
MRAGRARCSARSALALIGASSLFFHAVLAAQTPAWRCDADAVFAGGFEVTPALDPSNGSGGAFPITDSVSITSSAGNVTYHISVPLEYRPTLAAPLIVALHGAAGPGGQSIAAGATRDAWSLVPAKDAVVIATESSGASGGWIVATDQSKLLAAVADVSARYNIDRARIYGWGFSAGAHVMHRYALLNLPNQFAAYGISAGALQVSAGISAPSLAARKVPLHIDQGEFDTVVPLTVVQQDVQRFQAAGWILSPAPAANLYFELFQDGHTFDATRLGRIWGNICRFTLSAGG